MAGGSWTVVYTATLGATITHTNVNTENQNVINNQYPAVFDDHSATLAEMRTTSDPYASQVAVQATNLGIEIEQYRYQLIQAAKARGLNPTYWYEDITGMYALSSGTDTVTATFDPPVYAHTTGLPLLIKAGGTNTGATTFNPNSLGAKNVYVGASALTAGQITSGKGYWLMYDGTQYQLLNPDAGSTPDTITNVTGATTTLTEADCIGRKEYTNWNSVTINNFALPAAAASLKVRLRVTTGSATVGIKWTCAGAETATIGETVLANCTSYVVGSIWELACEQTGASTYKWRARLIGVQPRFTAMITSNQTITANTDTVINFDNQIEDNNADEYNTTTKTYSPTIPGRYNVSMQIGAKSNSAANKQVILSLYKDGSKVLRSSHGATGSSGNSTTFQVCYPISVTDQSSDFQGYVRGDDELTVYVGNETLRTDSFFIMERQPN